MPAVFRRSLTVKIPAAPTQEPRRRQGEIARSLTTLRIDVDLVDTATANFSVPDGTGRARSVAPPALTFGGDNAPFRPPDLRPPRPALQDEPTMHAYRSHTCGALRLADAGSNVRLSGWV